MVEADFQVLIDSLLSFAQSMVSEQGSFKPFGAVMYLDGSIQWVGADNGEEFPLGQALIEIMVESFKEKAASNEIRAAVICYDSLTIPPGETVKRDALCFNLEHRLGDSVSVLFPYARQENRDVQYSESFTVNRTSQSFSHSAIV